MNALAITRTTEQVEADRGHTLRDLLSLTTGQAGLSHRREQSAREATMQRMLPILEASDDLVACGVELEAIERRWNNHVAMHDGCTVGRPCWQFRLWRIRHARWQRKWDRIYRRLLEVR